MEWIPISFTQRKAAEKARWNPKELQEMNKLYFLTKSGVLTLWTHQVLDNCIMKTSNMYQQMELGRAVVPVIQMVNREKWQHVQTHISASWGM